MEGKELNANLLINRFFNIVRQSENIIFKDKRVGVFVERDLSNWSKIRLLLYKLSMPYLVFEEKTSIIYFFVNLFMFTMAFIALLLAQQLAWDPTVKVNSVYMISIDLFLFLSAWSFIEFLRDNRYSVVAKVILVTVLLILCLIQSISLFTIRNISVIPLDRLLKVNFLVGAGFTPFFILLTYTLVAVVWSYVILVRYTEAIQSPLTDQAIRQLLEVDVHENNGAKWKILDLDRDEITYLHKWAETNLDNSEKRTIPTLVLSTLLGFFISTSFFREMILNLFKPESSRNNLQAFIIAILLPLIAYFLSVFSKTLVSLFKNIATQSLIIETCIIAEYAIVKETNAQLQSARKRNIADLIVDFLSVFLHKF